MGGAFSMSEQKTPCASLATTTTLRTWPCAKHTPYANQSQTTCVEPAACRCLLPLLCCRCLLWSNTQVSIPLAAMATCWRRLADVVYEGDLEGGNATQRARDKGFRTAALIRFVGAEDGLLSQTGDGPRMFVNIEGDEPTKMLPPIRLAAAQCLVLV